MSAEPAQVMAKLDALAVELDQRSSDLADVERRLDPIEERYDDFLDSFIAGMFEDAAVGLEDGKTPRLPGEDVRRALAHKYLKGNDPEMLGEYRKLTRSRDRLKRRIETLGRAASAQQSILSALKREMEATGGYR